MATVEGGKRMRERTGRKSTIPGADHSTGCIVATPRVWSRIESVGWLT